MRALEVGPGNGPCPALLDGPFSEYLGLDSGAMVSDEELFEDFISAAQAIGVARHTRLFFAHGSVQELSMVSTEKFHHIYMANVIGDPSNFPRAQYKAGGVGRCREILDASASLLLRPEGTLCIVECLTPPPRQAVIDCLGEAGFNVGYCLAGDDFWLRYRDLSMLGENSREFVEEIVTGHGGYINPPYLITATVGC